MALPGELLAPCQRLVGGPQVTSFLFFPTHFNFQQLFFPLSLQVHSHGEIPRPLRPLAVAAGGRVPHPAAGGGGEGLLPPAGDRPGGAGRQEDAKLGHDLFFIKNFFLKKLCGFFCSLLSGHGERAPEPTVAKGQPQWPQGRLGRTGAVRGRNI